MIKLGLLTGGGDVPGLNPALKGLTLGALAAGYEVIGFRCGWQGVLQVDASSPESCKQWTMRLTAESVRTIDRFGGTFLHSSRTNPSKVKAADIPGHTSSALRRDLGNQLADCTGQVLKNLSDLGVDVLVAIGGDDTLGYGERLHREGFAVVGIPKTMDNDVFGTEYCLGFATAVQRSVTYLHQLRSSAGSHERVAVVEVMGRNAGYTSFYPAYLASCDRALVAEVPFEVERLAALIGSDRRNNPSRYAMLTVSEGATAHNQAVFESGEADAFGHRKLGGIGDWLGQQLQKLCNVGIIYQNLGYLVRCGAPDPVDVMVTFNFANLALELIRKQQFGRLVAIVKGCYTHVPLSEVAQGQRRLNVAALYDEQQYRPKIASVMDWPMYLC